MPTRAWLGLLCTTAVARVARATSSPACLPSWASTAPDGSSSGSCPYGHALPGQVTWPSQGYEEDPFSVVVAVFWSYTPWLASAVVVLELIITRGTRALFFAAFIGASTVLTEFVWKRILSQPRPQGSCLASCGMPSSHATLSIGLTTLVFLDLAYRVCPMDVAVLRKLREERAASLGCRWRHWAQALLLSNQGAVSNAKFVAAWLIWLALLGPVPFSRVYLHDHSVAQVAIGAGLGFLQALVWFFLGRQLVWVFNKNLGWRWPAGLKHFILQHDSGVLSHEILVRRLLEEPEEMERALAGQTLLCMPGGDGVVLPTPHAAGRERQPDQEQP